MTALEREQKLLRQWRALSVEKQQEALDYLASLGQQPNVKRPLRSALGLCADLNVRVTEEDITQACSCACDK